MPDQHQFHMREELAEAKRQGDDSETPERAPRRTPNGPSGGAEDATARSRSAAEEAPRATRGAPETPDPEGGR